MQMDKPNQLSMPLCALQRARVKVEQRLEREEDGLRRSGRWDDWRGLDDSIANVGYIKLRVQRQVDTTLHFDLSGPLLKRRVGDRKDMSSRRKIKHSSSLAVRLENGSRLGG